MTIDDIVAKLGLVPLPGEGGFFCETYRSTIEIPADLLPAGYSGARSIATAIYYLLTPDRFSALHRVRGDEVFHFYLGDPVEMLRLRADGGGEKIVLGNDLTRDMQVQVVVPGGTWQGSRLMPGGRFALLGTTMSPGFDRADFELGPRAPLSARYPSFTAEIRALTRD